MAKSEPNLLKHFIEQTKVESKELHSDTQKSQSQEQQSA
jgi:hypothetical protein